jgi:hypothetical protein
LKGRSVFDCGATIHGGIVIMAWVVGAFSINGVVMTGADRAPVLWLLGTGRPEPPSLLDSLWNSSMESSIMAHHRDGDPLQVEPMKAAPELLFLGERLRPLKLLTMN